MKGGSWKQQLGTASGGGLKNATVQVLIERNAFSIRVLKKIFIYLFIYFYWYFFFLICSEFCHTLKWNY